ncbi:MAG: hypothetical protein HQL99_15695 [Magnetococcales bacterium]|nr:hypothetical protein [Magnetococcales bacterium]
MATLQCFRPMPYFSFDFCKEFQIQPGSILSGNIQYTFNAPQPHTEDAVFNNPNYLRSATSEEFKEILDRTLSDSISSGFGVTFMAGQKHIPFGTTANCSIITVRIDKNEINIHEDMYNPGRIKVSFCDSTGFKFGYLSITDRGFYDYAINHRQNGTVDKINRFLLSQDEIILRVGVGRRYESQGKDGYWLQVNGIYTFPNYSKVIRSYG